MLIIFDFDGTLVELEDMQNAAYDAVFEKYNIEFDTRILPPGVPITHKIKILKDLGYDFDELEFRKCRDDWVVENVHKYLKYSKDLDDTLFKLSQNNTLCIASNAGIRYINKSCEILNITSYITRIHTADTYPAKPEPDMLSDMVNRFRYKDGCVIYEDSESGFAAARSAGVFCVRVSGQADLINKLKLHYDI